MTAGGYQNDPIDFACPFPWCGFEGTKSEIQDHVPDCDGESFHP